jgi:hypothetical protein
MMAEAWEGGGRRGEASIEIILIIVRRMRTGNLKKLGLSQQLAGSNDVSGSPALRDL